MAVAAMMATVSVNAQVEKLRHEIGVTYGTGLSTVGDGIGEGFARVIVAGIFGESTESVNEKSFGTLSLEYFYHLNNPRWAVGGIFGYAYFSNEYQKRSSGQKTEERTRTYYTVMPSVKYYWVNKEHFGFYSKVAVGATFDHDSREYFGNISSSESDNHTYFACQVSPAGVEAGTKNFRGFIEGGYGEQGIIALIGFRTKF